MADNTLTIALDGEVSLASFSEAMHQFQRLVTQLSNEIAPKQPVLWVIDSLEAGSAIATVRAAAQNVEPVLRIVQGYEAVGRAVAAGTSIPYTEAVARPAHALAALAGQQGVTEVRFETPGAEFSVVARAQSAEAPMPKPARGTIKGRVESLTSRGNLRFTLYDGVFDRAISCYVADEMREQLIDIWGKRVAVTGRVSRNGRGQATAIREITAIEILLDSSDPMSFRHARGVFEWTPDDEPAEIAIRRVRDGES